MLSRTLNYHYGDNDSNIIITKILSPDYNITVISMKLLGKHMVVSVDTTVNIKASKRISTNFLCKICWNSEVFNK